jgi:hypothetical protein
MEIAMSEKIARDLAAVTEALTAPAVIELNDAEIAAVGGGYSANSEKPKIAPVLS